MIHWFLLGFCVYRYSVLFQGKNLKVNEELEITAIDFYGLKRSYGYGKAIEGSLCQNHLKKINKILQNTDQVCITGDDEVFIESKETFSRWRGLETRKGKVSF